MHTNTIVYSGISVIRLFVFDFYYCQVFVINTEYINDTSIYILYTSIYVYNSCNIMINDHLRIYLSFKNNVLYVYIFTYLAMDHCQLVKKS